MPAARPTHRPDGSVEVPTFTLPISAFLSHEAAEKMRGRAGRQGFEGLAAPTLEAMREASERAVAPMVEASLRRYPVTIREAEIAGVRVREIEPADGRFDPDRVLVNLHGGGFMMCAEGCALVESIPIAAVGGFKVITVDYRQGPEHAFPAASEDVAAVLNALAERYPPSRTGLFGCSAGGALTTQVIAWLHDKKAPVPGAIGVFGAGGVRFGAGDSAHVAAYIDGSFPAPGPDGHVLPNLYFRDADMQGPLISPALHPEVLAAFPPTLVLTGTRAMDMSPAIYTHYQLLKAGVDADLIVGEGMGHCYLYDPDLPESREVYDLIVRFFRTHLGG